jgi:hypothetical protein
MMVASATVTRAKPAKLFELEALEGLPCGCVTVTYRARSWDLAVVSLEAKGPHCTLVGHTVGEILQLGDLDDLGRDEDDTL